MKSSGISGRILARNTILNFIGQSVPLIVGIITIPFIVQGLGTEKFGLLSLVWVVLGYFTIFDLGLGRATTKYIAEALGKEQTRDISKILWTAVTVQVVLGIIGTVVVAFCTPLLTEHVLNISTPLQAEARATFYVLSLSVPVVLITSSFSGLLQAAQRFDLVNAVKIPSSVLTFLFPLAGLILNFKLPGIVILILVGRVIALVAFVVLSLCVEPQAKRYSSSFSLFKRLLTFGGWVTITNIVGPILQYLDRFLIGAILTVGVLAYYTAPFDVISRLWIIPLSLVMTIFPAFSTLGLTRIKKLRFFFIRATKYIFLLVTPIILVLILFAHEILSVWLGNDFARNSTLIFRILSLGVLISSLTHLALALFQGIGRPEITAKIQLLLLPVSVLLTFFLIYKIGILGAAISWTICRTGGVLMSWRVAWKIIRLDRATLIKNGIVAEFIWFAAFASLLAPTMLFINILTKILCVLLIYTLFIILAWRYVLDSQDRTMVFSFCSQLLNRTNLRRYVSKGTTSQGK